MKLVRARSWLLLATLLGACSGPSAQRSAPTAAPQAALDLLRPSAANTCGIPNLREDVLRRVNALRSTGATCGGRRLPPAPPLVWNVALFSAAARHSQDMGSRNYFDHVSPDGRRVAQRASAEGYDWRAIAENIAGGDSDVESVMEGWTASRDHCRAMMAPEYSDVGVACVQRGGTKWGTYWTMVLGAPRSGRH